ncbi:MAG: hypothetical protein EBS29_10895, partial [Chloroflexia bacterium]|nr:hypothetical protein [Chloroflexia bacterium]
MDVAEKLAILAPAAHYEACDTHAVAGRRYQATKAHWSENALSAEADAKGVRRPVMRLLLSAECVHNCPYCPLRAGSDVPRATLTPDEAAAAVAPQLQRHNAGLLLSTAVVGSADASSMVLAWVRVGRGLSHGELHLSRRIPVLREVRRAQPSTQP